MRTYQFLLFASTSLLAWVAGCSSSTSSVETTSASAEELSIAERVVTVRRDVRRCAAPLCGGYWIGDVNRDRRERYVSSIDLSSTGVDDAALDDALTTPGALLVDGCLGPEDPIFGTRTFVAHDVWRGLPGVSADPLDAFFSVAPRTPPIECIVAPCPNLIASVVNARTRYAFDGVDLKPASLSFVDDTWLGARVVQHGAVVAASWERGDHFTGGDAWLLRVSQVYVHLPDRVGPCPAAPVKECAGGTIAAYQRNDDRCVIQTACVSPAICAMYRPACAEGYTLASWTSESGCPAFACDPSFIVK